MRDPAGKRANRAEWMMGRIQIDPEQAIGETFEIRHVLRHSHATELDMKIEMEKNVLTISVADKGVGISESSRSIGLGLDSFKRRMKSIGAHCRFEHLTGSDLRIILSAPVA